jgi:hypothetical protein
MQFYFVVNDAGAAAPGMTRREARRITVTPRSLPGTIA